MQLCKNRTLTWLLFIYSVCHMRGSHVQSIFRISMLLFFFLKKIDRQVIWRLKKCKWTAEPRMVRLLTLPILNHIAHFWTEKKMNFHYVYNFTIFCFLLCLAAGSIIQQLDTGWYIAAWSVTQTEGVASYGK